MLELLEVDGKKVKVTRSGGKGGAPASRKGAQARHKLVNEKKKRTVRRRRH
jgi:hypothetical protein